MEGEGHLCQTWLCLLGLIGVVTDSKMSLEGQESPENEDSNEAQKFSPLKLKKGISVGAGGAFVEENRLGRIQEVTEPQHLPSLCAGHGLNRRT